MATVPFVPLDYTDYSRVMTRAAFRKDTHHLPSTEAALRSLIAEEPHVSAYARALAQYTRGRAQRPQVRTSLTKQAPAQTAPGRTLPPNLAPASDAAASPALTPHEAVVKAMATLQQADPTLTSVQAQERVAHADPTLWERQRQVHLYGRESAPPVQTAALTYEQIVPLAKACAALTQRTTAEELAALALDHPDEGAYWQAARRFHLGEGRQEQAAAGRVAKAPPGGTASVPDGTVPETAGQRAYARLLRRAQEKYPELSPQEWHRKILLTVEGQNAMSDHRREVLFGPTGQEGA